MARVMLTTRGLTADKAARTVTGTILPYGEIGHTNMGPVTAAPGVTIPELVRANVGHDRNVPVGRLAAFDDTDSGITGTFSVSATPAGDALLAEIAAGDRDGLSVEIDDAVITDGVLSGGTLSWVGFVTEPAFSSARLTGADASETDATVNDDGSVTVATPSAVVTVSITETEPPPEDDTGTAEDEPPDNREDEEMAATTAAARPNVPVLTGGAQDDRNAIRSLRDYVTLWAAAKNGNDHRLLAALQDVTWSGIGVNVAQPQWIGELWSGNPYTRVIVPLINSGTLTSLKIQSWRWTTKPVMAEYAGDKADVPSNPIATEPVEDDATRYAGAHDIDRALVDFPNPAVLEGYYTAMTESYARLTDAAALNDLLAAAPTVTLGSVPSGVSASAAALVDAALAVAEVARPTFAVVAADVLRDLLLTPRDAVLELLSQSLGLEGGSVIGFSIIARPEMNPGTVLVGTRSAATFYELGGGAPIRVQALDIARGGVDAGVFGYGGTVIHMAEGLAKADVSPAAPLARKSAKD